MSAATSGAALRHIRHVVGGNPITGIASALFTLVALIALLGPTLAPYDPLASDATAAHPFGTNQLGHDILSRLLVATRLDFGIAATSVALVFVAGGFAGLAAGFYGSWVEALVGRLADTIMAFPLFVLALGIVAALGNTVPNIVLATAIINFPSTSASPAARPPCGGTQASSKPPAWPGTATWACYSARSCRTSCRS